jgi:multidrug efflux pump subunit AcrA (membrane-fusion protein)
VAETRSLTAQGEFRFIHDRWPLSVSRWDAGNAGANGNRDPGAVPQSSEYVATIKSRRSATLQPQVDGRLTQIRVHSGDHVKAGQVLMEIDPLHQQASVDSARPPSGRRRPSTTTTRSEIDRQRKLFEAGIISRDVYEQAQQAYDNTKADYESAVALRKTQEEQLAYYTFARRSTASWATFRCTWATTFRPPPC